MSTLRPIDEGLLETLREIDRKIRNGEAVDASTLREWMHSPTPELQATACYVILERPDLLARDSPLTLLDWAIEFLVERALIDEVNDYVPSCYDCLESMRARFLNLWTKPERFRDQLRKFKQETERLIKSIPAERADLVTLALLEHLFADPDVREFFSSWKSDPALSEPYNEGVRLATSGRASLQ